MTARVVNLEEKFGLLTEHWQSRVVAELNDYQFKIARVKGEFVWHDHADTDEAFFVLEGTLRIDLPDGAVQIGPGELYVVPRGVKHRPVAEEEAKLMLVEPRRRREHRRRARRPHDRVGRLDLKGDG